MEADCTLDGVENDIFAQYKNEMTARCEDDMPA